MMVDENKVNLETDNADKKEERPFAEESGAEEAAKAADVTDSDEVGAAGAPEAGSEMEAEADGGQEDTPLSREEQLEAEVRELKDKLLRKTAEFENFKKRTIKEKTDIFDMAVSETVALLLPVVDNLERAASACGDLPEDDKLLSGVKMVQAQLMDTFSQMGVVAIAANGEGFNPELHNAVMHVQDEEVGENVIIEEFMKGYMYKDKVIRHSMVKVAN